MDVAPETLQLIVGEGCAGEEGAAGRRCWRDWRFTERFAQNGEGAFREAEGHAADGGCRPDL